MKHLVSILVVIVFLAVAGGWANALFAGNYVNNAPWYLTIGVSVIVAALGIGVFKLIRWLYSKKFDTWKNTVLLLLPVIGLFSLNACQRAQPKIL